MSVRIEKHGKIMATFSTATLLTAGTNKKKADKVRKELRKRNYVAPIVEVTEEV
jgi:phage replication-related protein YjqB (UPF0714/DUF867 family)